MIKSAMIRARTDPSLKDEVEQIFKELGLTTTEAINLFFCQIKLRKGLPFEIAVPNKTTIRTLKDTDKNKNIVRVKNTKDIFDKLGI
ncbi:MAG: type II toxin-antitoxin system RelB/DinJ family antitoxin [Armatimonadetes bacterium]|nr:type II toxin-antitoxin system RelB/DinJ family antitoxin [Armatimonadota bacterium]